MNHKLMDRIKACFAAFKAPQVTYSQETIAIHNTSHYKELIHVHRELYKAHGNDKDLDLIKIATAKLDALKDLEAVKAGRRMSEN